MRFSLLVTVVLLLSLGTTATSLHPMAIAPTAATKNGTYFGMHVPQLS